MSTIDSLKAGQSIECTVTSAPRADAASKTIARLMRKDPAKARGLRRGQTLRARRNHRYIRGNRVWYAREKAAKIVRVVEGEAWSMTFTFDIASDLKSVEKYLNIQTG